MTTLIKAARVQYHAAQPLLDDPSDSRAIEPEDKACSVSRSSSIEQLRAERDAVELEALRASLAQSQKANEEHEAQLQRRIASAYESGFAEGEAVERARTVAETNARDTALRSGIDAAVKQFGTQLQTLEELCAAIALAALQRVIGNPSTRATLVRETVRHHLAQLTAASILAVDVSRDDFTADTDASDLLGPTADKGIALNVSPTLKGGECRIDLSLGALDASLDVQLARIRTALLEATA
ncbi:flagellar assembly protein H [Caballeronia pedi]|uniref:Flagellar assembly protein H n=1 Tax=Caballeronia pedi TaxID=1777141 RepID=A0A158C0H4_9BURK|nr:hypothetical protein [Caballeronia pedi]SAK75864.1 flagellar assembly protein H [Caballeronia pedi]